MNECKPKMKTIKLLNSMHQKEIPIIGLGTWQAKSHEIEDAVSNALQLGYRHIGK